MNELTINVPAKTETRRIGRMIVEEDFTAINYAGEVFELDDTDIGILETLAKKYIVKHPNYESHNIEKG